jgi:hypothetical protein
VRHVAAFLLGFLATWWLWQLLTGEWSKYEWIGGACAGVAAAAIGELAASRTQAHSAPPWAILAAAPMALAMVFADFVTVMGALVRRREGVFRETDFGHPDTEDFRAWATIVGDYSPNAYIVDITDGRTLTHHLVPRQKSQDPA